MQSLRRLALAFALAVPSFVAAGCATTKGLTGKPAPDFNLATLDGNTVSLSAMRGSVVVADFWASWCAPCRDELPELEKLRAEYEPKGVRFVAISVDDDKAAATQMAEKLNLTMPVALDTDKRAASSFQPPTMPSSYVIDRGGVVRFVHEGYNGTSDVAAFRHEIESLLAAQ